MTEHSNQDKLYYVLEEMKRILQEWLDTNHKYACIEKAYHADGTLVFDVIHKNDSSIIGLLMFNISDECYSWLQGGKQTTRLMDLKNLENIFKIYLIAHGRTPYYLECYQKSCIRHLFDTNMKRWEPMSKPLIDKYLWEAGITGGKTAKEIGEELSKWNRQYNN